jgi:hypothetical protein
MGYCNPTRFQTRGPEVQKGMFLYIESLLFI